MLALLAQDWYHLGFRPPVAVSAAGYFDYMLIRHVCDMELSDINIAY